MDRLLLSSLPQVSSNLYPPALNASQLLLFPFPPRPGPSIPPPRRWRPRASPTSPPSRPRWLTSRWSWHGCALLGGEGETWGKVGRGSTPQPASARERSELPRGGSRTASCMLASPTAPPHRLQLLRVPQAFALAPSAAPPHLHPLAFPRRRCGCASS